MDDGDLSDYFKTYFGDNLKKHILMPITEDVLIPSTRLLKKRQEELGTQKSMEIMKEEFDSTILSQRVRREKLDEKEVKIKEHLRTFDQFLKENELKQYRAVKKAGRERELVQQKEADMCVLRKELKNLITERDRLATLVEKNEIYPNYLDNVAKVVCKQFQEKRLVMSRFDTLLYTREDLLRSTRQNEARAESIRAQQTQYMEQNNDRLLHFNNKLAKLQTELDAACTSSMIWESTWVHIQNTAAKKTLLLGTIKMATLNLYQSMITKRDKDWNETVGQEDTLKQLDKIQTSICKLVSVWEEVTRMNPRRHNYLKSSAS